jgi:hypothetical protein
MWECPACKGFGNIVLMGCFTAPGPFVRDNDFKQMDCPHCHGLGTIDINQMKAIEFGDRIKDFRIKKMKMTIRQIGEGTWIDPSDQSCIETGRVWPSDIDPRKYQWLVSFWKEMLGDK